MKYSPGCKCCRCFCTGGIGEPPQMGPGGPKARPGKSLSLKVTVSGLPAFYEIKAWWAGIAEGPWGHFEYTGLNALNGEYFLPIPTDSDGCPNEVVSTTTLATESIAVVRESYWTFNADPCDEIFDTSGSFNMDVRVRAGYNNGVSALVNSDNMWQASFYPTHGFEGNTSALCPNFGDETVAVLPEKINHRVGLQNHVRCGMTSDACTAGPGDRCVIGDIVWEFVDVDP